KIKEGLNREFREWSTLVAQLTTISEPSLSPKRSRKIKMFTTLERIQDTETSEEKNKATSSGTKTRKSTKNIKEKETI
ncbi:8694_t:CDS:1, partial [Ambispora gerdemannii]